MHSSITIAQKFLDSASQDNGNTLTPMQLLKLVYIAHGYMLGQYSRPLIKEQVEAWKYGPVIKPLYDKIKSYRSDPVKRISHLLCSALFTSGLTKDEEAVIKQVYDKYGRKDGIFLSSLTHNTGTPWEIAWKSGYSDISNDLIENHYRLLLQNEVAV